MAFGHSPEAMAWTCATASPAFRSVWRHRCGRCRPPIQRFLSLLPIEWNIDYSSKAEDIGKEKTKGIIPVLIACTQAYMGLGEEFFAEEALFAVAAAGGAVFAAVEYDLKVEFVPGFAWEEFFEVVFGLCDVFALGEFPAFGKSVDVCVDGEGRDAEGLGHDNGSGFVADAGELFEVLEGGGDLAVMLVNEDVAEIGDGEGFGRRETAGADDGLDLFDGDESHFFRVVGEGEEGGGDFVYPDVGALGGEEDGDKEGVGAGMIEGDGCFRVEMVEAE
jgi:hypothetical protein